MPEESQHDQEEVWRKDTKSYLLLLYKHWEAWVGSVLGIGSVALWLGGGHVIAASILTGIALFGVGVAGFRVWRIQKDETKKAITERDLAIRAAATPSLKIDLKFRHLRYWNTDNATWRLRSEMLVVSLTNNGRAVSVSQIDLFVQKNGMDVVLPPYQEHLILPQPIESLHTILQQYDLGVGGFARMLEMSPRIVATTSCGHIEEVGPESFVTMRPFEGGSARSPIPPPDPR